MAGARPDRVTAGAGEHARYLVAGSGYTGQRLLAALPAGRAIGLRRTAATTLNGNPTQVIDLDQPLAAGTLPAADCIVYTVPPAGNPGTDARLQRLLAALPAAPVRLVYFSTTGVYGDCAGRRVDESARVNPSTARAARRCEAERTLADFCERHRVDLCLLRVPGIYGPGRLGVDRLRRGLPVLCEAEASPGNRVHVDDLVRAAIAATSPGVAPGVFNIGDGDHRSNSWFARTVAALAGLPPPPEVTRAQAERQFDRKRRSFLDESRRIDTTRMRVALGVVPVYADATDGIRASLDADGLLRERAAR